MEENKSPTQLNIYIYILPEIEVIILEIFTFKSTQEIQYNITTFFPALQNNALCNTTAITSLLLLYYCKIQMLPSDSAPCVCLIRQS